MSVCIVLSFLFHVPSILSPFFLFLRASSLGRSPRGCPRASREWFRFPRSDVLRGWLKGFLRGPTPRCNGLDASWGVDNLREQWLLRIFYRKFTLSYSYLRLENSFNRFIETAVETETAFYCYKVRYIIIFNFYNKNLYTVQKLQ